MRGFCSRSRAGWKVELGDGGWGPQTIEGGNLEARHLSRRYGWLALSLSVVVLFAASKMVSASTPEVSPWQKIDPDLRVQYAMALREVGNRSAQRADATLVPIYVETLDVTRTQQQIVSVGGVVGTVAGHVMTAQVPVLSIPEIAGATDVTHLEGAKRVHSNLNLALPAIQADAVHDQAPPLTMAYTGSGVVVGVIDAGLDLDPEAFDDASGESRVIAIWDQTRSGTPPAGYAYGNECTSVEIAADECTLSSSHEHGTHVTGIAAGQQVGALPYIGVAPEADIAFVNVNFSSTFSNAVCDAAAWIFSVAESLGKPAVVNMSLETHGGPHDGLSAADLCLDNLAGPGKILVAAAGNEGNGGTSYYGKTVSVHAYGTATAAPAVVEYALSGSPGFSYVTGNVVFDADVDLTLRFGVRDTEGDEAYSVPITIDSGIVQTNLTTENLVAGGVGTVTVSGGPLASGTRVIQFTVSDSNFDGVEAGLTWLIEITGDGRYDGFIDTTSGGGFLSGSDGTVDNSMSIGYPAIASGVLSVGSFVSRTSWGSVDGFTYHTLDDSGEIPAIGALSDFSSKGPSRNVAVTGLLPDIAAPGQMVASALNDAAAGSTDERRIVVDSPNGYSVLSGTSMASPAMAGAVALMLEADPTLTANDIRTILDGSSVAPPGVEVPNNDWGRGKLNVFGSMTALEEDAGGDGGGAGTGGEGATGGEGGTGGEGATGGEGGTGGEGATGGEGGTGGEGAAGGEGGGSGAAIIGEDGGTVTGDEPGLEAVIPAGALDNPTLIELRSTDEPDAQPIPDATPDSFVRATPHGVQFDTPVSMTIPKTEPGACEVFRLDDELDTTWEPVAGPITCTNDSVSFATTGFSIFGVFESTAGQGGAGASGGAGDGGSPGAGGSGGAGASGSEPPTSGGSGNTPAAPAASTSGGGGCAVGATRSTDSLWLVGGVLCGLALLRRRRQVAR